MPRLLQTALTLAALAVAIPADAQVLGTFRWQLQPFCNVITLIVTQVGGVYRVEGTDDQCGAATSASVTGTAFPNRNGSIGLGLNVVTAPGGTASPVEATIALANLNGTWRGPGGTSGSFVSTPGAPTAGSPRPLPAVAVPPAVSLLTGGSIVARQSGGSGIPADGPGVRMMWYAGKAAFRSGSVGGSEWDDANVGPFSTAIGVNTTAQGYASLAAGVSARASGRSSMAFGQNSTASGDVSFAAGWTTLASGETSTAFGYASVASGVLSLATGGATTASGRASFAGGLETVAGGDASFAFGIGSRADGHESVVLGHRAGSGAAAIGSFVFADHSGEVPFTSFLPNEFGARFAGGYYLYTRADLGTGVALAPGGSSWAALSDAHAKERFRDLDGEDLLARLSRVPIREWSYKGQDGGIRHMGPTAQDFRAAFGLGDFPLRINTIDADGVALAGVQALDVRTRAMQETLARAMQENEALRDVLGVVLRRIERLERTQP
jgi:hypothetical protein